MGMKNPNRTYNKTKRTEKMIEELIEKSGFSNASEVIRTAIATLYLFHKHYESFWDAVLKVAEDKGMVELQVGNKYTKHDKKDN